MLRPTTELIVTAARRMCGGLLRGDSPMSAVYAEYNAKNSWVWHSTYEQLTELAPKSSRAGRRDAADIATFLYAMRTLCQRGGGTNNQQRLYATGPAELRRILRAMRVDARDPNLMAGQLLRQAEDWLNEALDRHPVRSMARC